MSFSLEIALFMLSGIVIGFVAARLFYNKYISDTEKAALSSRLEYLEKERAELAQKSDDLLQRNARLENEIEKESAALTAQMKLIETTKTQMSDNFKAISLEALQLSRESFLALAQERLKSFQDNAKTDMEKRELAVKELVAPVGKSLETLDQKIAALEKERQGAYGELREHLKNLRSDQDKLRSETSSLVQALRSPATRGQWGEMQLKRTLEMAGLIEGVHYQQQVTVDGEQGRQRPDIVVKLPGGKSIVIDAKAPIDAYLDSLKDGLPEIERIAALERHARHVRDHIKMLGGKAYWSQFDTPEFVVLFLPGESYFSAALERDPSLLEAGVEQKVIPASPTTLISLLKAVAYGWQQEKLAKNAQEISDLGRELYGRISGFGDIMQKLGRSLGTALNSYNEAVGSLERRVLPSARRFQQMQVVGKDSDALLTIDAIEDSPRHLTAPEFTPDDTPQKKAENG